MLYNTLTSGGYIMHYNEFIHHLFLHKDLDEYLIKYKKLKLDEGKEIVIKF